MSEVKRPTITAVTREIVVEAGYDTQSDTEWEVASGDEPKYIILPTITAIHRQIEKKKVEIREHDTSEEEMEFSPEKAS